MMDVDWQQAGSEKSSDGHDVIVAKHTERTLRAQR